MKRSHAFVTEFCLPLLAAALAFRPASIQADCTTPEATIQFDQPPSGIPFTKPVVMAGGVLLIGLPFDDGGTTNTGLVLQFDTATGGLVRSLAEPVPAEENAFGQSVAVSGGSLFIGAPGRDDGATTNTGAIYEFDANSGALLRTISNPDPESTLSIGASLAVSESWILTGCGERHPDSGLYKSAARLLDRSTGSLVRAFSDPEGAAFTLFGFTLAVSEDFALIGNPYRMVSGGQNGIARLYSTATGSLLHTFAGVSTQVGFSATLAVEGADVIIGTPEGSGGTPETFMIGTVHHFDAVSGALIRLMPNPAPTAEGLFGRDLAISNGIAAIGGNGRGYLFNLASGDLLRTIGNPSIESGALFGGVIAMDGREIVVGGWRESPETGGVLHVFGCPPAGRAGGDFDADDCTSLPDFLFLLDHWSAVSPLGGVVMGLPDFLALIDHWRLGPGCE